MLGVEGRLDRSSVISLLGIALLAIVRLTGGGASAPPDPSTQQQETPAGDSPWYARTLSRRAVWSSITAGIIVAMVIALYVIYPAPGETFEELDKANAGLVSAVKTGDRSEAKRLVDHSEQLLGRLKIGATLRPWTHTEQHEAAIASHAQQLDELRSSLRDDQDEQSTGHAIACAASLRDYRRASQP